LRVGLAGVELPQHHLAVRPRQIENPVRQMPVLVFLDQADKACRGSLGHAGDDVDGGRLLGIKRDAIADRDDRVEHRTGAARQRPRRSSPGAQCVRPRPMKRIRSVS
jgi:hypothetical protein